MGERVVLMIRLGGIELGQRIEPRHDRTAEHVGAAELGDIGLGDFLLCLVGIEDRRAVLGADVGTLAVELGRVMGDGEEHLQDLAERDLARVVRHLHRLGMAGAPAAHLLVGRIGGVPPA